MSNFERFNKLRCLNQLFLVLFLCFVVVFINIFSASHYYRDYTNKNAHYRLSEETIQTITALNTQLKIYAIIENFESPAIESFKKDINRLFNEYIECEPNYAVSIEIIDPAHKSAALKDLSKISGILPNNVIVVRLDDRIKVLALEELYDIHNGEIVGFCGERVLTNAVRELVNREKKIIYFVRGHGEYDIGDVSPSNGISTLHNILKQKNYDVKELDFSDTHYVPDDANLVILIGQKTPLLANEIDYMRKFLDENGGNLIIAISSVKDKLLSEFIADHGICINYNDSIVPKGEHSRLGSDLIVKKYAQHGITNGLINLKLPIVFSEVYEVHEADWTSSVDNFLVTNLIQADGIPESKINVQDKEDQFIVSSLFERNAPCDVDIESFHGKLLVFGCSDFMANSKINVLGNKILFCDAIDFLVGADNNVSINSTRINSYRLALTNSQYYAIITTIGIICLLLILAGVMIYFIREK